MVSSQWLVGVVVVYFHLFIYFLGNEDSNMSLLLISLEAVLHIPSFYFD